MAFPRRSAGQCRANKPCCFKGDVTKMKLDTYTTAIASAISKSGNSLSHLVVNDLKPVENLFLSKLERFGSKNLKISHVFFQNIDFTPFKITWPRTTYRRLSTNKISIFSRKVALHGRMGPGPFYSTRAKGPGYEVVNTHNPLRAPTVQFPDI